MTKQYLKRLKKYPLAFRMKFIEIISKIEVGDFLDLDIVKLNGTEEKYRCRIGKFRIIFHKVSENDYEIDDIGSRGDIYK